MRGFTSIAAAAVLAGSAFAAPTKLVTRQTINANGTTAGGVSDVDVLQFALTLELLEINLYETVVTTYSDSDFVNAGFQAADRDTFLQIITQELNHIASIRSNIEMMGATPVQPCNYNYGNATSLNQLLNVTDAVNGLGPSAYLGAGAYISSKLVLTEGASIGNIETRHNSWLNGLIGRSEQPTAYLVPLSPTQSYGVASQFIVSCPSSNPTLKAVTAYPPTFKITNKGYPAAPLNAGDSLYFSASVGASSAAFLYSFNTTIVSLNSDGSATIPYDAAGQIYIVLTTAVQGELLDDANSVTAPQAFYVDAPAQAYADVQVTTYEF